jgi:sugar phosphate permease
VPKKMILTSTFMWLLAALFYSYEFFQRVAPAIMATPIMATFHLSQAKFAFINSFYLYAYALAQLPAGVLIDRYGPKACLSISALGVALGTLLFSETESLIFLGLARILIGIGSAFAFIGCLKIASQWFEGKTFALIVGLTNLLGVAGALLGEAPLAKLVDHLGWISSLKLSAWIGFFIALALFIFLKNSPKNFKNRNKILFFSAIRTLLKTPQNWLIALYAGIMVSPVIAFTELWAMPFLEKVDQFSSVDAASINQFIFIGIGVGGPIHGLISGKIGRRKPMMAIGQLMAIVSLIFIIMTHPSARILMGLMFFFGFSVSSMLLAFSLSTENQPKAFGGTAIAFTNLFIMLIGAAFQNMIGDGLTYFFPHTPDMHGLGISNDVFKLILFILPAALFLNFILLFFIKETYAQPVLLHKKSLKISKKT